MNTVSQNPARNDAGLFQPISVTQGSVKIGAFGPQGSGKTTTLFLLAIGLSLTYHKGAPIMYHDTENGSDFMKKIADAEGVPVLVRKSRSFTDMCAGIHEGERSGACVYLEDSITHDWNELMEAFKAKYGITKIQIDHWGQIKPQWANDWVVPMLNSPLHILIAGRAGMIYESVEQEDGSTKNEVTGSKMKAEGDFGYEPNLLIEMFGERVRMAPDGTPVKGKRRAAKHGGTYVHHAYVLKDRTRNLQGREFSWQNLNDYKKGDWKKVFDAFRPHFDFFAIGGAQRALTPSPSTELFSTDNSWYKRKQKITIILEEIEATLTAVWPGTDKESKRFKAMAIDTIFGTRSWTKITTYPLGALEVGLCRLESIERRTKETPLDTEEIVTSVLNEAMTYHTDAQRDENQAAKMDSILGALTQDMKTVYVRLSEATPLGLDELIEISGIPASQAMSALSDLELKGLVGKIPGNQYVRVPLARVNMEVVNEKAATATV